MNATELHALKDGECKPAGCWYCGECRIVKRTQQEAEECCSPRLCRHCGKAIEKAYHLACDACIKDQWKKDAEEKRLARMAKAKRCDPAENVDCWYDDDSNKYLFGELEEVLCDYEEGTEPEVLYFCRAQKLTLDATDILDRIEESLELEDEIGLAKDYADSLQAVLDAWIEANAKGRVLCYHDDPTRCVETAAYVPQEPTP